MNRKQGWIVIASVAVFTAGYLWYVKNERRAAIKKYLPDPKEGDVYKMQQQTREGVSVFYLKIKDIGQQSIYFYPSRWTANAPNDFYLKNFDTTETEVYAKKELMAITAGEWNVPGRNRTLLLEIER